MATVDTKSSVTLLLACEVDADRLDSLGHGRGWQVWLLV